MQLTPQQYKVLSLMCDALIPSVERADDPHGYWERKASDLGVPEKLVSVIQAQPIENQESFIQLLDLLNSSFVGLTWFGPFKSADQLTDSQREQLLQSWSLSAIPLLRNGFNTLKRLTSFIYFGTSDHKAPNPNWAVINYPGVPGGKARQSPLIDTLTIREANILECDTVIVGSGAGGGVVAAVLAQKGESVIVVEKGQYIREEEMNQREAEMIERTFERKGALTSQDGAVSIFAGSCLGGGTTVNWSASFRTPDYILEEWAKEHDNPQFIDPEYKKCFEAIETRTAIGTQWSAQHNPQNEALFTGAQKLGMHAGLIPRNVTGPASGESEDQYWKGQGYSCLGDRYGHKQGVLRTFLQDAKEKGARFLVGTEVEKVLVQQGKATGVLASQIDENGNRQEVRIRARRVVVSAGSIHTPALLRRSGLQHSEIGQNLYLHPVVPVLGMYDRPMEGWHGPMMSAVSDEYTQLDGNFGYKLETPPLHAGLMGLSTPWKSGQHFKQELLGASHAASFIVLTRDKFGGQVKLSKAGQPLVHYRLNPYDKAHLLHGLQQSFRIHAAAGAHTIKLLHNEGDTWQKGDSLEKFLPRIPKKSWAPNRFVLFSAHQMGTCRMGGGNRRHPLKPTGESREVDNLYVADASAFPRCSGVNPMLSIQAMAWYIAKGMS